VQPEVKGPSPPSDLEVSRWTEGLTAHPSISLITSAGSSWACEADTEAAKCDGIPASSEIPVKVNSGQQVDLS
jgi:hypothetical protein